MSNLVNQTILKECLFFLSTDINSLSGGAKAAYQSILKLSEAYSSVKIATLSTNHVDLSLLPSNVSVDFIYNLPSSLKPFYFFGINAMPALNLIANYSNDMYFFCWHTVFTDILGVALFLSSLKSPNFYVISHGTYSGGLRNYSASPRQLACILYNILFNRLFLPLVISNCKSIYLINFDLYSERSFDQKYAIHHFPSKIRFEYNDVAFPARLPCIQQLVHQVVHRYREINNLDPSMLLITRPTRAKGFNRLSSFVKALDLSLRRQSYTKKVIINVCLPTVPSVVVKKQLKALELLCTGECHVRISFYFGLSPAQIATRFFRVSSAAISLSPIECEPFSITEPLAYSIPCYSLNAGLIRVVPGVLICKNYIDLAAMVAAQLVNDAFRYHVALNSVIGGAYVLTRVNANSAINLPS